MKKIKGTLFLKSDNIADIVCGYPKKSNFMDNIINKAKELGYTIIFK